MTDEFDLLDPLPDGTTVLEASAGTGKTSTIAALVCRYVAEGIARLDELLVVTFGRFATLELRDRVRARLVSARDALADPAAAISSVDPLVRHLAAREADVRHRRLVEALSSFDSATVATTHEFCRRVLAGLGTAADIDENATFVENLDDLTVEVVQDLYLRMWSRDNAADPPMTVAEATELAHAVVRDSQAVLVPADAQPDGVADLRYRFATAVRDEVERRKRERYLLTFDDLLTRLRTTLVASGGAATAAARLRARYRIVLVDEFQDTDPVQWDILRIAFHGHATLVLIGDPKQAIYAFRGADVHAYLAAADIADHHRTLAHNWRSDAALLDGLAAVFRGAALGDERIVVHDVEAGRHGRSLTDCAGGSGGHAPVEVRAIRSDPVRKPALERAVVDDVVTKIVSLLDSDAELTPRGEREPRRVRPGDIAVVVDTNTQLDLVHDTLLTAGVPSVRRTTSSVFKTSAGTDWIVLLEALEQPQRTTRLRRLAITPFVGWDAATLDTDSIDALGVRLRRWVRIFDERGIAALLEAVSRDEALAPRLLSEIDGERRLTDLRHVGEALHSAATSGQLGLAAMLDWLRRRVRESHRDTTAERSRRLDSDAAAVQLVTVWASKGLEFPVVLVPFEWDRYQREDTVPLLHDADGRRVRDVGDAAYPGFADSAERARTELLGEHLRLLYVAMTRAQAMVVAWWAPSKYTSESAPLHRLLFTDDPSAGVPEKRAVLPEARAAAVLMSRAVPGRLAITPVTPGEPPKWRGDDRPVERLAAAELGRTVDATWRRTSYSALTRDAHELTPGVGSEPELGEKDDEPETPAVSPTLPDRLRDIPSPMADLPGGTSFGTLVHGVLEYVDTTAPDLEAEVRAQVEKQIGRFDAGLDPAALTDGLLPSLLTPLGPLADDRTLAWIRPADRLSELDFELPLTGGDCPNGRRVLGDLAAIVREHLPPDDPLAGYPDLLADPLVGSSVLRGYLNGSIDSVLRVRGDTDRFVIVDYKTNRLGDVTAPLTAWDYRTDAMADAMLHAHYPLQALLYAVALHRFLRWRIDGYDPDVHLGGILYLFLRGMCGPGVTDTDGSIPGVFAWRPTAALVTATSDALARGDRR